MNNKEVIKKVVELISEMDGIIVYNSGSELQRAKLANGSYAWVAVSFSGDSYLNENIIDINATWGSLNKGIIADDLNIIGFENAINGITLKDFNGNKYKVKEFLKTDEEYFNLRVEALDKIGENIRKVEGNICYAPVTAFDWTPIID